MVVSLLLTIVSTLCAATPHAGDFHVAPSGNDANPGTEDAPFATIGQAQRAVRARTAQGLQKDITVLIRGGVYRLATPLVFGPEDSGTDEHSITYAAYPGETPVLTGGRAITGWQEAADNKWTVELPEVASGAWAFRQLFADGERLPRGRYPNAPVLFRVKSVSEDVTEIVLDQALGVDDLVGEKAELVMYQNWSISRVAIASSSDATLHLANPMGWIGHGSATTASPHKPAYVEHALAFVDAPGEWYLDYDSGVLTYQAAQGENPNTRTFLAPGIDQLMIVEGRPDAPILNMHFAGLTFEYTRWERPTFGYLGIQAGHHGTRMDQPTQVLPSAIEFSYSQDCGLENCRVAHTGACGVVFGPGCRRNVVSGCALEDIGGNGIMVGWRGKGQVTGKEQGGDFHLSGDWIEPRDVPTGNAITGTILQTCGAVNHGCVGIFDAFAAGTRIAHNVVHDMPYTGISVGFRWDESLTSQRDSIIEFNHVYDTMKMLADGGCLYTLGYQPGTIIRGNVFHDVHRSAFAHGGAPNNGIFFDQGSKGYHVIGNTIYNTSGDPVRFNQTHEDNHTWENNRFGVGPDRPKDGAI
jgi:glycosyl hydrolase family 141